VKSIPVAPNLFALNPLRLIGGRHRGTGRLVFPLPLDADYESVDLPDRGRLWSHTVQRFAPKSPPYQGVVPFEPFAVGYIDLADAIIIESRLIDVAFDRLRVGMPMQLTTLALRPSADGGSLTTYAFRPTSTDA
jgi:uncharacterized OB-fold protein